MIIYNYILSMADELSAKRFAEHVEAVFRFDNNWLIRMYIIVNENKI